MSVQQESGNSQKRIAYMLIAITLAFSLMALWLVYFDNTDEAATQTSFKLQQRDFVETVNLLHVQWMRLGRPEVMSTAMVLANGNQREIRMSKQGWPVIPTPNEQGCEKLWQLLMGSEMAYSKQQITTRYTQDESATQSCTYRHAGSQSFIYSPQHGGVTVL